VLALTTPIVAQAVPPSNLGPRGLKPRPGPLEFFAALLSSKFRFARDSLLEGDGFEPSVPRQIFSAARTCAIEPRALRQAEQWINARRIEWERRLDGLGEYLKTLETKGDCDGSGD
jgi:hypothetical protein